MSRYNPLFFDVQEMVPPEVYARFGHERSWWFIDQNLMRTLDTLREHLRRPITVNNWHIGGDRAQSGFRTPDSPYYSTFSQHSFGRAADFIMDGMTAEDVRRHIMSNEHLYPHIGGVELNVSWVHIDVRQNDWIGYFEP